MVCSKILPKHPPLTLSVGSAATYRNQISSVKLEHPKSPVPRYLQIYLLILLSFLFSPSLALSLSLFLFLMISLFQGTPVFEQTFNHIMSVAVLLFSRLLDPLLHLISLPPPSSLLPQISQSGWQKLGLHYKLK